MPRQLNERQKKVLQWVGRGCPDGIWEGTAHKLSCQALQSRGLVKGSKRQGQWSAVLTDAAQHHLDHTAAALRTGIRSPAGTSDPESNAKDGSVLADATNQFLSPKRAKTVTEQLLEELAESGGRIVKCEAGGRETEKWPLRVAAARRSGKIPETKDLHAGWCHDGYEIRLFDTPAWRLAVLPRIPVPVRLATPHPVVKALQGHPSP
ncbi:hypothetical protein J7E99_38990 [Streptomyces sp. ISL-44]|uniref:hypothetical protein n=1 Tax=Streptomyces sp. ISL-44 TaxID=2819184 RepID=UPI001BE9DDE5|nr:hypothetical protein [Streptomyces sp. ISL-44]MBT2546485.1 hypothetical protein [Streptomyces sp. ISL-44]